MHQLPQTAVELPCTTDHTSCRVQHSLQLVGDDLWSPSEDNVTVVDAGRHKGVHERRGRLDPKSVSAGCAVVDADGRRADVGNMLLEAEVSRKNHSKHSNVLTWCDDSLSKLEGWEAAIPIERERLIPAQSSSVLSMLSFTRLADIQ